MEKCHDIESHGVDQEEHGPSPRSQLLLKQLENLVGRVVEDKLERVLNAGNKIEGPIVNAIATQTQSIMKSCLSQTEQLDCLTAKPKVWLSPSEPQALKDPPDQSELPDSERSTADTSDKQKTELQSMRTTCDTLRSRLRSRESQVQNLSKQLNDTRQKLWKQVQEQKAQLSYIDTRNVEDPDVCESITVLNYRIKMLSQKLNGETMRASKWAMIAKQQRLFLLQTESTGEPVQDLLRRHPAGIVFTAPPPCPDDDDYGDLWDVSNGAGANPYVVDSWPMEPNGLAQRCPRNVPFGENVMEESSEDEDSLSDREASSSTQNSWADRPPASKPGLRLPSLPHPSESQWSSRSERSVRSF